MSNTEHAPTEEDICSARAVAPAEPDHEVLRPREVPLGGQRAMPVRRVLPNRDRRMIGAWCFADSYGPVDITEQPGMRVPPHPHIGLQTVTWLTEGTVAHQDSLGSDVLIHPGELALMTAGNGIAHAELSPARRPRMLHGAQLWIALPASARTMAPAFELHTEPPEFETGAGKVTVFAGTLGSVTAPATVHSPLLGAAFELSGTEGLTVPVRADFEHGVLALTETLSVEGHPLRPGELAYLGRGRNRLTVSATQPARALLLGGEPFAEDLVMWWNFLGRNHEEIRAAREDWEREHDTDAPSRRFAAVTGYTGPALAAPPLPNTRLKARGRYRAH